MPAKCTNHDHRVPNDITPAGRCRACVKEAQRRYGKSCRDAKRKLSAIEAALALA